MQSVAFGFKVPSFQRQEVIISGRMLFSFSAQRLVIWFESRSEWLKSVPSWQLATTKSVPRGASNH
jgi:hypothetical protein